MRLEDRIAQVESLVTQWKDAGKAILKEVDALQIELRKIKQCPPLMGTKEVSEALDIMPSNILRKKGMPKPVQYVSGRPLWLESEVMEFKTKLEGRNYL